MGITPKDIAAQRAMLARGEAIAAVKNHHAERVRLRDEFAAAALTGLLADDGDRTEYAMPNFTARAYEWADAMLRERNGAVDGCETVTLTDEEREAIEAAAMSLDGTHSLDYVKRARQAATLRSLLTRLHT
jgi:hypothetical protein